MPLLKLCWRKPVIESVTALRIVKHLNVVEDALPGAVPSCISLVLDAFTLQELKKPFSDSIVMTVSKSGSCWAQANALFPLKFMVRALLIQSLLDISFRRPYG